MLAGKSRCADCGREAQPLTAGESAVEGVCATCGSPLDAGALSEFASRLARFGLGATRRPLLSRLPELPDAK